MNWYVDGKLVGVLLQKHKMIVWLKVLTQNVGRVLIPMQASQSRVNS
jgi:hypothetical protein